MKSSSRCRGTARRWAELAIFFLLFLCTGLSSFAAVTAESVSSAATAGTSATLTFNHTVVGNYRYLVVEVTLNTRNSTAATVSGVTLNGSATGWAKISPAAPATSNNRRVEFWGLANPPLGTVTIVVNTSGAVGFAAAAVTLNGVDPTTPTPATPAVYANSSAFGSNASTVTSPSAASGLVLDALAATEGVTATVGAGQTQLWSGQSGASNNDVYGYGTYQAGTGANVVMSETLSGTAVWKVGAVTFNPYATVADISITGSFSQDLFSVGNNATLTYTITNNGPSSATGVTFSETALPTNLTGVSAYSSVGSCTVTTSISCPLGTMANAATVTVTIVGTASSVGTISSTGSVSINEYDPYANSSYTATTVAQGPVCVNNGKDGVGNVTTTVNTY